ncbi:NAD(P)H-binding protein [Mycobacterium hodleri]|uniref:NAD(P)H-binding protein n=1 Tax=Mycolicibacterium hodleri TaxID=49897 RepID=UPI0021F30CC1|nr:NAD(P)H-binding protein [Mycolicibacterium hodleri]MCV7133992.1 NAD(P)H-binding protein [Mycolicibacterium hodleri]
MKTFIIGITGGVGGQTARQLRARGDDVAGLIRRPEQQAELVEFGAEGRVGDLTELTPEALAELMGPVDVALFSAGSGGGDMQATTAIDGDGVGKAIEAAAIAGVGRFVLVSVFPEAWRDRDEGEGFEHYIRVKKGADVALTRSDLDWVILRPAALLDDPGRGSITLGPAEIHDEVSRADVAATLAEIIHQPGISRQILELTAGDVPIPDAVAANVRRETA